MGQYRFSLYFKPQFGLLLRIDADFVTIQLPFLEMLFGVQKGAAGCYIFGKEY